MENGVLTMVVVVWDDGGGEWYYYCVPNHLLLLSLTGHKLTHTKEKPFVCYVDGCDYAAARKDDLASKVAGLWEEGKWVLPIVVVVVWDDDGGEWYYYCVVRCDVCT